jgi:ATP-dependent Clp protease ATP-binding subunit ClpC
MTAADQTLPLTPRAQRAVAAAVELARDLGHGYVGAEHLFLALATDGNGIPGAVLAQADPSGSISAQVRERMEPPAADGPSGSS